MKNTIKALSKQFFGAKYESARKSLLAAAILFIAIYAAEIRVAVAPAILYLTSTLFTAGVMWQVLTGRRQMEAMQGMLMLPLDHRGFVFGYVLVLGAHTLVTKTLLVWALFFAAASWRIGRSPLRSCAAVWRVQRRRRGIGCAGEVMLCCRSFGSPVSWPLFCSCASGRRSFLRRR